MPTEFDDPLTQQFEELSQGQINELSSPFQSSPQEQSFLDLLSQWSRNFMGGASFPGLDLLNEVVRAGIGNAQTPLSTPALDQLMMVAQGGPRGPDVRKYLTSAGERVESARSAAKERALQRAASRGLGIGSGVIEGENQQLESQYDTLRSQAEREAAMNVEQIVQQRYGQSIQASAAAAAAEGNKLGLETQRLGLPASLANLLFQGQMGSAGFNRQSQLAGINLAGLSAEQARALRLEASQRQQAAVALAGMLAELPERRLRLAQGLPGGDLNSLMGILLQLAGIGQTGNQTNSAAWQKLLEGLGRMFAGAPGTGTSGTTQGTGGEDWDW